MSRVASSAFMPLYWAIHRAQVDSAISSWGHTPEQIIRKLAEGQKLLAGGMDLEGCAVVATSVGPFLSPPR